MVNGAFIEPRYAKHLLVACYGALLEVFANDSIFYIFTALTNKECLGLVGIKPSR
jgi:hypothetical protein